MGKGTEGRGRRQEWGRGEEESGEQGEGRRVGKGGERGRSGPMEELEWWGRVGSGAC